MAAKLWQPADGTRAIWTPVGQNIARNAPGAGPFVKEPGARNAARKTGWLLEDRDAAAVLRPRGLIALRHLRPLLAVADGLDAVRIDALRNQVVADGVGPAFAESQVVLAGAALVAVAFDGDCVVGVLTEPSRLLVQRFLGIGANLIAVVVEEHAITDIHLEVFNRTRRRGAAGRAAAGVGGRRFLVGRATREQQRRRDESQNS